MTIKNNYMYFVLKELQLCCGLFQVKNELDKLFEDIKEGDKTTCIDPVQVELV